MSTSTRFRTALLAVGSATGIAVTTTVAHAFEAKISGHVNRAIMYVDDGELTETHFVDTDTSSTRFRFTGSQEIQPGLKAGIVWESEFQSNPSDLVTQTNKSIAPTLGERHIDAYLQGSFGKLSLGQGDGAANAGTEVDLSGTSVINYAGIRDIGGAITFRAAGDPSSSAGSGPAINSVINQLDFESRYDRVRYDTPALGPVTISASFGTNGGFDVTELAGWFSSDLGGGSKLAAAVGFSTKDVGGATGDVETTGGSISWLGGNGFNVTVALSTREDDSGAPDDDFQYLKVGYKAGKHAVSVDYGRGEDQVANGDDADMIGVGYVYTPVKWAELYVGAKVHSLDRSAGSFDDITILTGGTRLKF